MLETVKVRQSRSRRHGRYLGEEYGEKKMKELRKMRESQELIKMANRLLANVK